MMLVAYAEAIPPAFRMTRKFSSFVPLALGPRLWDPVIRIGLWPNGAISTTLLWTIANVCGSFFISLTNHAVGLSIAAGRVTAQSALAKFAPSNSSNRAALLVA